MDDLDRRLLRELQRHFPLVPEPFAELAGRLGVSEQAVISRVQTLKERGVIRKIGPVFDPQRLGAVSALVAVKVARDRIEEVAEAANAYREVTHNYEREGEVNLWFTIIAGDRARLEEVFSAVADTPGVEAAHLLPAERRFKIRVDFDPGEGQP